MLIYFFVSTHRQIDPSASCSVTSAQIEQCYNRNQRGVMEFYTAKYTYRLDFSSKMAHLTLFQKLCIEVNINSLTGSTFSLVMRQINVTTGKQRPIKRSLHSATGFRYNHLMIKKININTQEQWGKQIFLRHHQRFRWFPCPEISIFVCLYWYVSGSSVTIWPCLFHVTGRESTQTIPTRYLFCDS